MTLQKRILLYTLMVVALQKGEGFLQSWSFRIRALERVPANKQGVLLEISEFSLTPYISTRDPPYPLRKFREKV